MISRPPVLPQSRLLFPATQAGSPRGAAPPSALELQSPSSVPPIAGRTPCPQDPWPALPATCPRLYLLHRGRTVTLADRAAATTVRCGKASGKWGCSIFFHHESTLRYASVLLLLPSAM